MTGQDADIVRASLQIALYNKIWIIKPKNLNCDGKQEINIQLVGADSRVCPNNNEQPAYPYTLI